MKDLICPKPRAIIGLGNMEPQYALSPHNIGFALVEKLAAEAGVAFESGKMREALVADVRIADQEVRLVKPTTGMNDSGRAFAELMVEQGFDFPQVLVTYDDLDLNWGRMRFKQNGPSTARHLGLASVMQWVLNERKVTLLKLGIGPDPGGANRFEYVTRPVPPAVTDLYAAVVAEAAIAASHWVEHGFMSAMNKCNGTIVTVS